MTACVSGKALAAGIARQGFQTGPMFHRNHAYVIRIDQVGEKNHHFIGAAEVMGLQYPRTASRSFADAKPAANALPLTIHNRRVSEGSTPRLRVGL